MLFPRSSFLAGRRQASYKQNTMRIVLIDDSVPFDGATPTLRPLGGAERAFVYLAAALARRGHQVSAINRCDEAAVIDGVSWQPWAAERPDYADVLIAYRKAELLNGVTVASHRILWTTEAAHHLDDPPAAGWVQRFFPILAFVGEAQVGHWRAPKGMIARIVPPAPGPLSCAGAAVMPDEPPRAVVTSHPARLGGLIRLWQTKIRPACPAAELVLYSALLSKGAHGKDGQGKDGQGDAVPADIRPVLDEVLDEVLAAEADGVRIAAPLADDGMVEAFRTARVHLYPANAREMMCLSLMESQAVGIPAVAFDAGGARDRIENGQTGYVVPDEDAFASLAVRFLTDEDMFWNASHEAAASQRRRSWDDVALEFEALWRLRV